MWRLFAGMLVGVGLTIALYSAVDQVTLIYNGTNSIRDITIITLAVVVWAASSVGIGTLAGVTFGRLEFPVAIGSGLLGLIVASLMPDSVAEPTTLLFSAIPFLGLVAIGSLIAWSIRTQQSA